MKYLPSERETTIRFSDDKSEGIRIFTSSPVIHRRLLKRGLTPCRIWPKVGKPLGWFFAGGYRIWPWCFPGPKRRANA